MNETNTIRAILLAVTNSLRNVRLFRNNTGQGWAGAASPLVNNRIIVSNPHPLQAGLCRGSSDLIGWTTITIGPEMVGQKIAVFTAIEVKSETGRVSKDQLNFIATVKEAGGLSGVVKSADEAVERLREY